MKISFVLPGLSFTGGVRVVFEYADRLSKRGHNVDVVAPTLLPHPITYLRRVGLTKSVQKFLLSSGEKLNNIWDTEANIVHIPYYSTSFRHFLSESTQDSDVIIATEWRTVKPVENLKTPAKKYHFVQHYEVNSLWNNRNCWERAKQRSIKTGESVDISMAKIDTDGFRLPEKEMVDRAMSSPLPKIVISDFLKKIVEDCFDQNIIRKIPNGVDFDTFYCERNPNYKTILAPYRNETNKGSHDAIKAFRHIRQQYHSDLEFEMFGPVSADLPSWITYHESISDDELRDLYSKSGIFIFPSWAEGFGLPVAEAMACRSAIVTTNVGAVPDLGTNEKHFLTVPPQSPEQLADRVLYYLSNRNQAESIARAAESRIKHFNWTRAIVEFETTVLD